MVPDYPTYYPLHSRCILLLPSTCCGLWAVELMPKGVVFSFRCLSFTCSGLQGQQSRGQIKPPCWPRLCMKGSSSECSSCRQMCRLETGRLLHCTLILRQLLCKETLRSSKLKLGSRCDNLCGVQKRKEKTAPFGFNSNRSLVLYRIAQRGGYAVFILQRTMAVCC